MSTNASPEAMIVTQMQTVSTLLADITVPVRKDLLEMVARVQVNSSFRVKLEQAVISV